MGTIKYKINSVFLNIYAILYLLYIPINSHAQNSDNDSTFYQKKVDSLKLIGKIEFLENGIRDFNKCKGYDKLLQVEYNLLLQYSQISKFNNGVALVKNKLNDSFFVVNGKFKIISNGVRKNDNGIDYALSSAGKVIYIIYNELIYDTVESGRNVKLPNGKHTSFKEFENASKTLKWINIPIKIMEPAPQKIKRKYLNQQDLIRSGFDKATDFHGAYASVEKRRKWFIIDTLGNRICKNYDDAFYFSEGRARVGLNGKYGYIDESGKEVIPLIYDEVEEWFNDGRAGVKLKGRWGFVDTKGNQVIKCKYQQVWWFSYGVAKVFADKKFLFIDKFGNEVLNLRNDAKKYWESLEKCTQYRLK